MRFYGIVGLCAFSLALTAVYAVKKAKEKKNEKKHEPEEVQKVSNMYSRVIPEQEAEQPVEIPVESAAEEPEQQLQESAFNLKEFLHDLKLEITQEQQPEESTSPEKYEKMLEEIRNVLQNDILSIKEKHDSFDRIFGNFAKHTPVFEKWKFDVGTMDYELITPEICLAYIYYYVSNETYHFADIPGVLVDAEICEYAFHLNRSVISSIPVEYVTDEMLKKMPASKESFFMIPKQLRNEKICRKALLDAKHAKEKPNRLFQILKRIPAEHMNRDMIMLYMECGGLINHDFDHLELPDGWEEWIPASVSEHLSFWDKPEKLRTTNDYIEACKKGEIQLHRFPVKLNYEQYKSICSSNGIALQSVPQKMRDAEICMIAVKNNGLALKSVPQALRTEEICTAAMLNNQEAFLKIPKHLKENPDNFHELIEKLITTAWVKEHYIDNDIREFILCRINETQFETWLINLTTAGKNEYTIKSIMKELELYHKEHFLTEHLKEKIWLHRRNQYISSSVNAHYNYWKNGIFSETEVKERIAHDYDLCMAMAKRTDFSTIPPEMQTHEIISAMLHANRKRAEKYIPAEVLKTFYHIQEK